MSQKVDLSTVRLPIHQISNPKVPSFQFQTSPPLPCSVFVPNSPRMASDDATQTIFITISNFINSDIENPDEFLDFEPSSTNFFSTIITAYKIF